MHHEIGQAAGEIWSYLGARGESSVLKIRSDLKYSQTLLHLALGWLSREGKIDLVIRDRTTWARAKT